MTWSCYCLLLALVHLSVQRGELLVALGSLHLHGAQRLGVLLVDAPEHRHQAQQLTELGLGVCNTAKEGTIRLG